MIGDLALERGLQQPLGQLLQRLEAGGADPEAAAEQLTCLRDHAGQRQVSVRVRPLTAPCTPEPLDRFTITTDARGRSMVFVEAREPSGLLIFRDSEHIELYLRIFAGLCRDSLDENDSRRRIADGCGVQSGASKDAVCR
ncbi:Scr1 family TA system antitoxin-like transcriptional regulator [Amycolatopsis regifaucium]|uniref:Scr1 family TA system antitoxin-like transcriptional regulator n=1 Tax=Amycolatopsis regifaucium TaxID=546365 RepID=UPI0011600E21|nr:Scr1 family TA system antitoxin-like transcriptional regulator [Amycolatopsis regifaucium]